MTDAGYILQTIPDYTSGITLGFISAVLLGVLVALFSGERD